MTLDTEIKHWENVGSIEYAVSPPEQNSGNGNIYVRGEPEALKEFFLAFFSSKRRNREEFESLYGRKFQALAKAEAQKEPVDRNEFELNFSCERFYIRGRFEHGGRQIRAKPVLDYFNMYIADNFKDMERQFAAALDKYSKDSIRV